MCRACRIMYVVLIYEPYPIISNNKIIPPPPIRLQQFLINKGYQDFFHKLLFSLFILFLSSVNVTGRGRLESV